MTFLSNDLCANLECQCVLKLFKVGSLMVIKWHFGVVNIFARDDQVFEKATTFILDMCECEEW